MFAAPKTTRRPVPFDSARVNELRQALSEGSYRIDAQRIADRLLAMESDLS